MALTKTPIELSSTPGIVDNSNDTAITIAASGATTVTADTTSDWALAVSNGTNSNAFGLFVNAPSSSGIPLRVDGGGSERMRILPTGGITFNGDTAQANALNDYEEGTFTVGFSGATISPSNTTGIYTKIGRQVYWTYYSQASTISNASGAALITGLPFAVQNNVNAYQPFFTAHNSFFGGSATVGVSGYHNIGATSALFIITGGAVYSTYVNGAGKYLMISGFYLTDA
jgi:hypothetical protein